MLGLRDSLPGKVFSLHKDLTLTTRTHITIPGMVRCTYDPRVEEVETGGSLGLVSS